MKKYLDQLQAKARIRLEFGGQVVSIKKSLRDYANVEWAAHHIPLDTGNTNGHPLLLKNSNAPPAAYLPSWVEESVEYTERLKEYEALQHPKEKPNTSSSRTHKNHALFYVKWRLLKNILVSEKNKNKFLSCFVDRFITS